MTAAVLLALFVTAAPSGARGNDVTVTALVQQSGIAFLSERVNAFGLGGGVGVQVDWRRRYLAQVDANLLWAAGNTAAARLAVGAHRDGWWAPAAWGTMNLLWGGRIEQLSETGQRPASPSCALGARVSPLRFAGVAGVLSALEVGAAISPSGGVWLELTVLQAGARF